MVRVTEIHRTFSSYIDEIRAFSIFRRDHCLRVYARGDPSHIQKRNCERALSVDTNCSGIARADGAFYVTIAAISKWISNFIRSFGNENGTRNRGLSRVNAARIPIDLIHPGVMMASEHKLHLV